MFRGEIPSPSGGWGAAGLRIRATSGGSWTHSASGLLSLSRSTPETFSPAEAFFFCEPSDPIHTVENKVGNWIKQLQQTLRHYPFKFNDIPRKTLKPSKPPMEHRAWQLTQEC